MPTLYVVATPIGNLEDITLRALRVLKEVGLIAAEDTRVTRRLLERYDINTPMISYNEHNSRQKTPVILDALADKDAALVSDAGMPGINDPGYELVRAASEAGIQVAAIPGPSALTSAIAVSGLPVEQFIYLGFLPKSKTERLKLLKPIVTERRAIVAFETPHRLKAALQDILDALGDRRIAVCRELTKLHEEVFRGTLSEAIAYFVEPRGEFTLVIEGSSEREAVALDAAQDAAHLLAQLREQGLGAKEAVARVVEVTGMPRREVYRLWLETSPPAPLRFRRGG